MHPRLNPCVLQAHLGRLYSTAAVAVSHGAGSPSPGSASCDSLENLPPADTAHAWSGPTSLSSTDADRRSLASSIRTPDTASDAPTTPRSGVGNSSEAESPHADVGDDGAAWAPRKPRFDSPQAMYARALAAIVSSSAPDLRDPAGLFPAHTQPGVTPTPEHLSAGYQHRCESPRSFPCRPRSNPCTARYE